MFHLYRNFVPQRPIANDKQFGIECALGQNAQRLEQECMTFFFSQSPGQNDQEIVARKPRALFSSADPTGDATVVATALGMTLTAPRRRCDA